MPPAPFVGVLAASLFRRRDAHFFEQSIYPVHGPFRCRENGKGILELACHGKHRVHGRGRVLQHQSDLFSPEGRQGPDRLVRHIDSIDENGAGYNAGRGFQPDKAAGEKALAAPGFPHKAVDFSPFKAKVHIPQQDLVACLCPDSDPKTADPQHFPARPALNRHAANPCQSCGSAGIFPPGGSGIPGHDPIRR